MIKLNTINALENYCLLGTDFLNSPVLFIVIMYLHHPKIMLKGNCGKQPGHSSLTMDCPNLRHYPNPNIRKSAVNSSLAAVW